jgi:integrase/recombinase XerD
MSITVSSSLDVRRLKKTTHAYPVKLLLTVNGEPYRYQTVHDLSKEDWDKLSAKHINGKLQSIKDDISAIQKNAESYIKQKTTFSVDEFERDFVKDNPLFIQRKRKRKSERDFSIPKPSAVNLCPYKKKFPILNETHPYEDSISFAFVSYVTKLLEEERVGSTVNYQDTYHSLKKFSGNVKFCEIKPSYLFQYEKWMRNKGCSKSTVGIKLRPLRAIFNYAIDGLGIIKRDSYPFGRYKYLIPTSKNAKKSLAMNIIGKMYYYEPTCKAESSVRDFWFFLYFGNGMNTKDMADLKYKNIQGEYLVSKEQKQLIPQALILSQSQLI